MNQALVQGWRFYNSPEPTNGHYQFIDRSTTSLPCGTSVMSSNLVNYNMTCLSMMNKEQKFLVYIPGNILSKNDLDNLIASTIAKGFNYQYFITKLCYVLTNRNYGELAVVLTNGCVNDNTQFNKKLRSGRQN